MSRLSALLLLLLAVPAARAESFPQVKMDVLDLSKAPLVTVGFSFLDSDRRPVKPKHLDEVLIQRHAHPDDRRGTLARKLVDGKPESKLDDGELLTADKADRPLDVVVVVSGYGNPLFTETEVGNAIRDAVELVFKKLPKSARRNVLWVGDGVESRVLDAGRVDELSRLNSDQIQRLCRESRLKWLERDPGEAPEDEGDEAPKGPACGLHEEDGKSADVVRQRGRFEGHYPALFGLPDRFPKGALPTHENRVTMKRGVVDEDDPGSARLLSAMDEALRMLLIGSPPGTPKALILVADGRDGSVEALELWRREWKDECDEKHPRDHDEAGACVTAFEQRYLTDREVFFRARAERWLTLMRAAHVRAFSLALPGAAAYERERLRVLAEVSGGTYREAESVEQILDGAASLTSELAGQLVVTFTDPTLLPEASVGYSVQLRAARRSFAAREALFGVVPELPAGPMAQGKRLFGKLKAAVGSPWHWVILVVVVILALLLLFLVLRLGVKLIKGLIGKVKGAAGQAAKGPKLPGGVPKGPRMPKAAPPKGVKVPKGWKP